MSTTSILATDLISASRATINGNFASVMSGDITPNTVLTNAVSTYSIDIGLGGVTSYLGVGIIGLAVVAADFRESAKIAASSTTALTVGVADSTYQVSAYVRVTTATNHNFTVTCSYTDEGNTARTLTLSFTLVAGGTLVTGVANANGTVPYMGLPQIIRCKAGTTISFNTTGTFTTVVYNWEVFVIQLNNS